MKDVFISSTLKAEWNRTFNPLLCEKLEEHGVTCHLPQRDTQQGGTELDKYTQNIGGIDNAQRLLTIGVNESINWGLETGYAFGSGKEIILLTDAEHTIPTMSLGMYYEVLRVDDLDAIDTYIETLVSLCKK